MQNFVIIDRVEKLQAELAEIPEDQQEARDKKQEEIDELIGNTNVGMAKCDKTGYELIELEEAVKFEQGCWVRFMKLPAQSAEADAGKGKGKAAKGAAPVDEVKPVIGKAWLSLTDLVKPGATQTTQRVYLQTCPPLTKKVNEDGTEEEVEDEEFEKVFEDAKTYIHIKVKIDRPIVAIGEDNADPSPDEIVPLKQFVTWPYSKDPCDDFGKQVTLAVESLAKEFFNMFKP